MALLSFNCSTSERFAVTSSMRFVLRQQRFLAPRVLRGEVTFAQFVGTGFERRALADRRRAWCSRPIWPIGARRFQWAFRRRLC